MYLFDPVHSFDSTFAISRRQSSDSSCGGGGVGTGECLPGSSCRGIIYANQCWDTPGDECCLHRTCSTPLGGGHCKNRDNQTCDGEYYTGAFDPSEPTCPGPNYIVCCVEWAQMDNGTSSDSNSTATATTTSSSTTSAGPSGTETGDEETGGDGSGGLSASAKGGIAGGIVGAVAVMTIVFLLFFFLRRRTQQRQQEENAKEDKEEGGDEGRGTASEEPGSPRREGAEREPETEAAMLASRMKLELDGTSQELHEMDAPPATTALSASEKAQMEQMKSRRFAELPGSLATVAEMPAESEARGGHGHEADVKRA
ncbi:hypothetical protein BDV06DRAFT_223398 [Aspergillus oleicola]